MKFELNLSEERRLKVYDDLSHGSHPRGSFFLLVAVSTLIASFGLIMNSTAVVIGVTYVQMTSLFMEYDLVWPRQLERFLVLLGSVVTLNVPDMMMSPNCEYAFGYAEKWFFSVASPIWMLSCFALVSAAASRCYQNRMVVEKIRDQCIQGSCIFVTLMYVRR